MQVADLKQKFQDALDKLEQMPDDAEIDLEPNTVGMNGDYLYIDGFRDRGFVNLETLG